MWWGPTFAFYGAKSACGNKANCSQITMVNISLRFGVVMTLSGLLGVPAGSYVSQILRHKVPNADPLVCAVTLLASVPVLFFGFVSANYSISLCYGLTFLAGLLLNANWSIVSDMTLYIVIPTRRGVATATQILVSHMLGDACSPYLIGSMADAYRPLIGNATSVTVHQTAVHNILSGNGPNELTPEEYDLEFRALEYSLFSCCFFQAMGAFFFFVVSWYVLSDKSKAERQIACNADMVGRTHGTHGTHEEVVRHVAAYREDVDFRDGTQPIIREMDAES